MLALSLFRGFGRSFTVAEVVVNIPQLSRLTFAVTKDGKDLAKRIFIQLTSRVAVRPLRPDEGYPAEAIASLHTLFRWLREELLGTPGTPPPGKPNAEVLAYNLMNEQLAPFLARWHRRHQDWRDAHPDTPESAWPGVELTHRLRMLQPLAGVAA